MATEATFEIEQPKTITRRPFFSRDNPAFLATTFTAVFCLIDNGVRASGICGVPDLETRPLSYPLLATAFATMLLRPRHPASWICLAVSLLLSGDVFCVLAYKSGLIKHGVFHDFGYFLITGIGWGPLGPGNAEVIFHVLLTAPILSACASVFNRDRFLTAIALSIGAWMLSGVLITGSILALHSVFPDRYFWESTSRVVLLMVPPIVFWHLFCASRTKKTDVQRINTLQNDASSDGA